MGPSTYALLSVSVAVSTVRLWPAKSNVESHRDTQDLDSCRPVDVAGPRDLHSVGAMAGRLSSAVRITDCTSSVIKLHEDASAACRLRFC